ncbi:MAG: phosphoribosylformylglycinamidine synthase subunit PurS [Sulfobacillus sp.]
MTYHLVVEVLPKGGMLDPQGDAVQASLAALGFDQASAVRVGRLISLTVQAASADQAMQLGEQMANALLANPVMETYRVAVHAT